MTSTTNTPRPFGRPVGFTLVELLVVIGIIALLISILLPALNRARAQANTVKCLANLRSIGQGVMIYAAQNRGTLPYGRWDDVTKQPGSNPFPKVTPFDDKDNTSDWCGLLAGTVMGKAKGNTYAELRNSSSNVSASFTCPTAQPGFTTPAYFVNHYASHPRLMPDLDERDQSLATKPLMTPYKIAKIRQSANIALIWDAAQRLSNGAGATDGNACAVGRGADFGGLYRGDDDSKGHTYNFLLVGARAGSGTMPLNLDQPVYATNKDWISSSTVPENTSEIRWRHGKNDTANFVYADGHADTRRLKQNTNSDFTLRNLYVNR
jgi:prepilin-type N-terminal cleavage/methylation domain-containing protein/prepilin-type processing-associated H-X9-DG protein